MAKTGHVRIKDVELYPNLAPSLGCIVACTIEELGVAGCCMYHVEARSFITLGCDVGADNDPFPFYASEVEVVSES